ncbi:MAG: DMT family transporter [Clostridia bacterium]|nr:DMT family transporter [Clostridia bacterium]
MNVNDSKAPTRGQSFYYAGLITVIFIWSVSPVINPYIYVDISPTIASFITGLVSVLSLIPIAIKNFSHFNARLLKVAIPTGIINSVASLIQKIGLLYTTPSRYAFLENISCVIVPILMFILVRKKPTVTKIISSLICLFGCFLLSGAGSGGGGIGIGEILCALAGILYGINIAITATFAARIYAPLYIFIHMAVHTVTSGISAIALDVITFNGEPISEAYFEWNFALIALLVVVSLLSNTFCWIVRTNVMKHIDATVVAIMMPFSAVITGVLSVLLGMDTISPSLIFGAIAMLIATILSGLSDSFEKKKMLAELNSNAHKISSELQNEEKRADAVL